ncbi:CheR family methyltransferase [Roseivivax isoporae]|uniref:Chemotaxis protein methyltransferase n=1 Tax=Roseivivax isoporae LMG 25204 TaxID=1449351 RepID=X7FD07_9RHOB|nr:CheR family methyltransferase [Roseivivax isoporae]ETX30613.1 chemotaxis protein [Roseivivax isoporae LMG 25204]
MTPSLPAETAAWTGAYDCAFTDRDFAEISAMLRTDAGISLGPENRQLVFARLVKHVRRLGLSSFADYVDLVRHGDPAERYGMVMSLTTHTTRFFREGQHFDILARDVLPGLVDRVRGGGRLRLWSAGCSTGEEAYSIAAVLLGAFPDAGRFDVRILATDISREVLEVAALGRYRDAGLNAVPETLRPVLFEPGGADMVQVRADVRRLVSFRYMNFMEPWPMRGPFDAIFCRNVAIYMDEGTQARIWRGLEQVLGPEGYLFIGHSERLGPEFRDRLELCGKTTFRRPRAPKPDSRTLTHVT